MTEKLNVEQLADKFVSAPDSRYDSDKVQVIVIGEISQTSKLLMNYTEDKNGGTSRLVDPRPAVKNVERANVEIKVIRAKVNALKIDKPVFVVFRDANKVSYVSPLETLETKIKACQTAENIKIRPLGGFVGKIDKPVETEKPDDKVLAEWAEFDKPADDKPKK